jgi:ribose 5-phosphate isomerase A
MNNYKLEAAKAALSFINAGQAIGLGAGSSIANLIDLISLQNSLVKSLIFVTSSFKTRIYLQEKGLITQSAAMVEKLDIYFDGCDQFDLELNALKSGGGIHTSEKFLASIADEFVLIGDEGKLSPQLTNTYPLVIEILPEAFRGVFKYITTYFADATINLRMSTQKDGALISDNGNLLADIKFNKLPDLKELNTHIKMIPGVLEHSLFYHMATKAVIAGEHGVTIITPNYL